MPALPLRDRRIGLLTSSASRLGGGVFEAVVEQVQLIRQLGGVPVVIALEDGYSREDEHRLRPAEIHFEPTAGPRQIGFAPGLVRRLAEARLECLHLHGIWMYPSAAAATWARATGAPYLISPHGMLDRWITARGRWKKGLARLGYERRSWRAATAFHALTGRERADIARETGRDETVVIPNASPPSGPANRDSARHDVVYIGRIHPKKNLGELIAAWTSLPSTAESRLLIAGWGEPLAVDELRHLVERAGPQVQFLGPVYGAEKEALLGRARYVVLPSLSEGLPMAVLEAWSLGIPTLMTHECNLPEGFAARAALDCGTTSASIAAALHKALDVSPRDWSTMSDAAICLARGRFSPDTIAEQWARTYLGLIAGRPLASPEQLNRVPA